MNAGGRYAYGAVREYMKLDKEDRGAEFIRVIEEGMEKSKKTLGKKSPTPKVEKKPEPVKEDINEDIEDEIDNIDPVDEVPFTEDMASDYPDDLIGTIRTMFKDCEEKDLKAEVKELIAKHGKLNECDEDALKEIYDKLK